MRPRALGGRKARDPPAAAAMSANESNDVPLLPPRGHQDVGEETMESVDAGLLGSGSVQEYASGPIDAELVEESSLDDTQASALDAESDATVNFGPETVAGLKSAATRRLGDFELERKIGQGGMGEVWLARQVSLDRPVAVKVLPRALATQENFIERFQREAKAAASLVHPSVIQIYAYGIDEGTPYFAMEYVEGEDLQQRIRRERFLEWDEVAAILVSVAAALEVAHEKGLIHRDIKPSNIMIDKKGIVKVMDFGLAKATSGGPEAKNLTNAGLIMGTPNYLSPEQGRGDSLDGRSDLYSLGIVLYELITGQLPFKADSPAGLIFKHVYEPPPPPADLRPDVPPFLVDITLKLLEKDPDDRYRDACEFRGDLEDFRDNYEHYVEGGERMTPREGALPGVRRNSASGVMPAVPGRRHRTTSPSSRRNAITEPVTKPIKKGEVELEDPLAAETILEGAPQAREPQAPIPRSRRTPPPKAKKSKVPLLVLGLLGCGALGAGYAWQFHNDDTRGFLTQLGLLQPREGKQPTPSDSPGQSPVLVDPSESPSLAPSAGPLNEREVNYGYEGTWPEGYEIQLGRAKHDPIVLQRGSFGRYEPADDYRITFLRPGYEQVSFPVRLQRSPTDRERGVLRDSDGNDVDVQRLRWKPTAALREAYLAGHAALQEGRLDEAQSQLEAAARLDPGYRLPKDGEQVPSTVAELLTQVAKRRQEAAAASQRLNETVQAAKQQAAALKWRDAIAVLKGWPKQEELPSEAVALVKQWQARVEQGEEILSGVQAAIARGDHEAAAKGLGRVGGVDASNPDTSRLRERLDLAKVARRRALEEQGEVAAQLARVDDYLSGFGPEDSTLKLRREGLAARMTEVQRFQVELAALENDAKAGRWDSVHQRSRTLLKDEATKDNQRLQQLYKTSLEEIARVQIRGVLERLDGSLCSGKSDETLRFFDPENKETCELETLALRRFAEVGSFVASEHAIKKVELQANFAQVMTEWTFKLKLLDQPPQTFVATQVFEFRRVAQGEGGWLISVLKIKDGVRAP